MVLIHFSVFTLLEYTARGGGGGGGVALFRTVFQLRIHCAARVCKTVHAVETVDTCK